MNQEALAHWGLSRQKKKAKREGIGGSVGVLVISGVEYRHCVGT